MLDLKIKNLYIISPFTTVINGLKKDINVVATRAKKHFTIIGDLDLWGNLNFFKEAKNILDKE